MVTYLERLREIALDWHGFATAAQAVAEGIPKTELPKMAARERIERVRHGVYRIPQVPATPSDPHDPPTFHNDRARDIVDLLLLRDLIRETGNPIPSDIKVAILDIFAARAGDDAVLGYPERRWPVWVIAYPTGPPASSGQRARPGCRSTSMRPSLRRTAGWMSSEPTDRGPGSR